MSTRDEEAPVAGNNRGLNFNDLKPNYKTKPANLSPSSVEILRNFRQSILETVGHAPDTISTSGKLERFSSSGKPGDKSGWYVLHIHHQGAAGAYGCWRSGVRETWGSSTGKGRLRADEWQQIQAAIAEGRKQAAAERASRATQAHQKAVAMWGASQAADPAHPYLLRKRVGAYGIRQLGKLLLVPLCDFDGVLHSIQTITPEGDKRFLSGTPKRGLFHLLGESLHHPHRVYLCEGYATGASLYEAVGVPVIMAFDAGNLLPVATTYRAMFPHVPLILCADNDRKTEGNPGLTHAREVARQVRGVSLIIPEFAETAPLDFSDFNDFVALLGSKAKELLP